MHEVIDGPRVDQGLYLLNPTKIAVMNVGSMCRSSWPECMVLYPMGIDRELHLQHETMQIILPPHGHMPTSCLSRMLRKYIVSPTHRTVSRK